MDTNNYNPVIEQRKLCNGCSQPTMHREMIVALPCRTHGEHAKAGLVCENCGLMRAHDGTMIDLVLLTGTEGLAIVRPALYEGKSPARKGPNLPFGNK